MPNSSNESYKKFLPRENENASAQTSKHVLERAQLVLSLQVQSFQPNYTSTMSKQLLEIGVGLMNQQIIFSGRTH